MSRYRRSLAGGATLFFTVNTYRRTRLLTHPDVRAALRDAIERTRSILPFTIDAWVLLPDHLHAIWTLPEGDAAYGKRWGIIKAQVSRACMHLIENGTQRRLSRIKRRELDFWQRRSLRQAQDRRDDHVPRLPGYPLVRAAVLVNHHARKADPSRRFRWTPRCSAPFDKLVCLS